MSTRRGRRRPLAPGFQDLVCFSDGCRGFQLSAAAILHSPAAGELAHGGNVAQEMRCSWGCPGMWAAALHPGLTAGALELAGIALSLTLLTNYALAFCGAAGSGGQPGTLSMSAYSDDLPIVEFVLQGGASDAGARHLEGLVGHVRGMLDALRSDPASSQVFLLWAPRGTQGMRRADQLARSGALAEWPDRLEQLLLDSSQAYLAASPQDQSVMDRY